MRVATVLYEDRMRPSPSGEYPLHDLVMRIVEDDINGETWELRKIVEKNPRKGIGNVLNDVRRTELIAGSGDLFLLVDRDVIAQHLDLATNASECPQTAEAVQARCWSRPWSHLVVRRRCTALLRSVVGRSYGGISRSFPGGA